jgi:prepilin-type N-terminal cleavage/methylation domain-containing protein
MKRMRNNMKSYPLNRESKMRILKRRKRESEGFSLIETLVGVALVAIALLGLAQLMVLSIANNTRADRMSNATFLARQQIEQLRLLTAEELITQVGAPLDEQLDLNQDGVFDYRRITVLQQSGAFYQARILIFAAEKLSISQGELLADPDAHRVRADITSLISR